MTTSKAIAKIEKAGIKLDVNSRGQYYGGGISFYDQQGTVICLKAYDTYVSSVSTALAIVKHS